MEGKVRFSKGTRTLEFPLREGRVGVSGVLKAFGAGVLMWKDDDGAFKHLRELNPDFGTFFKKPGELSSDIFIPGKIYPVVDAISLQGGGSGPFAFPLFDGRVGVSGVLDAFGADALNVSGTEVRADGSSFWAEHLLLREDGEFSQCRFYPKEYHAEMRHRYHVERGENEDERTHSYVLASQGLKKVEDCGIEDTYAVATTPGVSLFGVFDGHVGAAASRFCAKHMFKYLMQNECFQRGEYGESLRQVFLQMDRLMRSKAGLQEIQNLALEPPVHDDSILLTEEHGLGVHMVWPEDHPGYFVHASPGTCAIVVLVLDKKVYIANAGDCVCSLYRSKELIHLTTDHRPDTPEESERIRKAGGQIERYLSIPGRERDAGALNISRGIGDLQFKMNGEICQEEQIVSAVPDIVEVDITKDCEFLIIYSDGLWRGYFDSSRCEKISMALEADDMDGVEKALGIDMKVWRRELSWDAPDDRTVIVVSLKHAGLC